MCHSSGTDPVTSITFDITGEHFDVDDVLIYYRGTPPTTLGSFDFETSTWTGELNYGDCFRIGVTGTVNGDDGDNVSTDIEIASSRNPGDIPNVDPDSSSNSVSLGNWTIAPYHDFAFDIEWVTNESVHANEPFSLDGVISNVGGATYNWGSWDVNFIMVMPEDSTLSGVVDLDTDDTLTPECEEMSDSHDFAYLIEEYDSEVLTCSISSSTYSFEAGQELRIRINGIAGPNGLTAGSSRFIGAVLAPDSDEIDTAELIEKFMRGENFLTAPYNNINNTAFNPGALVATVERCSGQSETISIDDACFEISFNRDIESETFTKEDITITGGGQVASFSQDNDNKWTVKISGMTPNTQIAVGLAAQATIDAFGVENEVQVLGTNTVRYQVSGAAQGTLPATGADTNFAFPVMLCAIGCLLMLVALPRKRTSSRIHVI